MHERAIISEKQKEIPGTRVDDRDSICDKSMLKTSKIFSIFAKFPAEFGSAGENMI